MALGERFRQRARVGRQWLWAWGLILALLVPAQWAVSADDRSYYRLNRMVTNLKTRGRPLFLQITIHLKVDDLSTVAALEKHNAQVEHGLLMLFSEQTKSNITNLNQRKELQKKSLDVINSVFEREAPTSPRVSQVLFTSVLIQ